MIGKVGCVRGVVEPLAVVRCWHSNPQSQTWEAGPQLQKRGGISRNLYFDVKVLLFRPASFGKQIVHVGYDARHAIRLLNFADTSMPK